MRLVIPLNHKRLWKTMWFVLYRRHVREFIAHQTFNSFHDFQTIVVYRANVVPGTVMNLHPREWNDPTTKDRE